MLGAARHSLGVWTALRAAAGTPSVEDRPATPATPAFADVYRDHAAFVWRVLRRLGVGDDEVEDACQEVFLVVHRKLAGFEHRSALRTWLYSIAVRCASHRRRRGRRGAPVGALATAPEPAVEAAQADDLARREARVELDAILDELDDAKRAVFVLYELEELTMAEVAATIGCPLQTAYSRLQAARAAVEASVRRRRAKERA